MTRYEWDETKNESNLSDHGVDFETGQQVFSDPLFVSFVESVKEGEERWHAIGIISCRKASRHERKVYEEG